MQGNCITNGWHGQRSSAREAQTGLVVAPGMPCECVEAITAVRQDTMNYGTMNECLFCRKCAMLHYATCNNRPAASVVVPQECTMKVQEGKFKLQDLLVVPMQRVLKYHLLLKVGGVSQLQNLQ